MKYRIKQPPEIIAGRSVELFDSGLYCAESVLQAFCEAMDISSDLVPRIATGFGSGMGRSDGMCGAMTGALMVMGIARGRDGEDRSLEPCYDAVSAFISRFSARFGATHCHDLLGCDLSTAKGQRRFYEDDRIEKCVEYIHTAALLVCKLLNEPACNT